MEFFWNLDNNPPKGRIISKCSTSDAMYQSTNDLTSNDDLKLELVKTFLFNLRGAHFSTFEDFFIHFRDKEQIKEITLCGKWPFGYLFANIYSA